MAMWRGDTGYPVRGHLLCLQNGYHTGWTPASIPGTAFTLLSPASQHAREPHVAWRLFCRCGAPLP